MSSKIYIHYGATTFNPFRFKPIKNIPYFFKPDGGIWGSPIDSSKAWKDWCRANNFREYDVNNSFKFKLKDDTNLLYIDNIDKILNLPTTETVEEHLGLPQYVETNHMWLCLDFEALVKKGVDAIEVSISSDFNLYYKLYGWDCDSILVMNKNVIHEL